ncbi:unnamed protein product [Peniophora sp. CBMAI 1063]|nr:unnamed protein product [Peniophora sp. CBMAI 1063]
MTHRGISDVLISIPLARRVIQSVGEHPVLAIGAIVGFVVFRGVRYLQSPWRKLPPGPRGLPIIGNALQVAGAQWLQYSSWRKEYGDIIYLEAVGQPIVVLNNSKDAIELLDHRAGIYSDRPALIVACDLMTNGLFMALTRYGDLWRRMRKAGHESLKKVVAHTFHGYQSLEAVLLARDALEDPAAWDGHLRRASASLAMSCIYDEPPLVSPQDARLHHVNDFTDRLMHAAAPGAHWVEVLPWMRHIPSLLAPWKRAAQDSRRKDGAIFLSLYEHVQHNMAKCDERPSLCSTLCHSATRLGLTSLQNAWIAATMYVGGSETTYSTMSWWSLAMLAYPECQRRAQVELDLIVGRARVPTFADMPQLCYIQAMVKEILRWQPMLPIAAPHTSIEDDFYKGFFIPKGTMVIPNVWEMNRDPAIYGDDAHKFNPARHLDKEGKLLPGLPGTKEDSHHTFGFGRRICIGKHVANNSLLIEMATCLWAFSLVNPEGQVPKFDEFIESGLVVHPKPFEVNVQSRFPEAMSILSHECELRGS